MSRPLSYSQLHVVSIMAVAVVAKERIEKELTCPLCLDIFGEPKKLPCDHIYCKEPCLKGLLLRSLNGTIVCPECRTVVQVPQNDLNNLPTAFRVNRFKEAFEEMQQKEETDSQAVKQTTCTTHKSQPLAIYCETCEEVLCRDCLLKSDTHKDHHHGFIEEVAEKRREAIMKHVETAKECKKYLSGAIEQISQERLKVQTQTNLNLDQLDASCDAIVSELIREREQLRSRIVDETQKKIDALKRQELNMTTCLNELSSTIEIANITTQNQNYQEITLNTRTHIVELKQACTKVKGLPVQPAEKADYTLRLTPSGKVVNSYRQGNYHYTLADPQKCKFEGSASLETGKKCTAILKARDYAGKQCTYLQPEDIQVELLCIRNNTVIHGLASLLPTGNYTISVTPQSRGRHMLSVKVDNAHISGSPFSVYVHIPPQQLGQPIHTITELENPTGLVYCNDKLHLTNNSHIVVLNENFKIIETHYLKGANEIAIDTETRHWFVNTDHHQLHKFDNKYGKSVTSVGSQGSGPDQFHCPNGLKISKSGELFVCDTQNHRIKVYNKELQLQRIIGKKGKKNGCFKHPGIIDFDDTGNLYVTEESNHRIQVLNPDGKTIRIIGQQGHKIGELDNPIGITICGQYMYIVDRGNTRISVFTTKGEFITIFGARILHQPDCIAIDRDGYVYVSDNHEHICVF